MIIMASSEVQQNEGFSDADSSSEEDNKIEIETPAVNDSQKNYAPSSETDNEDEPTTNINEGWADSIAKILKTNKPKGKKTLVLSKAKKLNEVRIVKPEGKSFEVQSQDGKIKTEEINPTKVEQEEKSNEPLRKRKRELPNLRVKPNILEKDREKMLAKIATKGVVQLFNAVKGQQKDIAVKLKEAGPLEVKRDKVLKNIDKRAFLDVLMGEKSQNVEELNRNAELQSKSTEGCKPTWSVLRDDFMMSAKLRDWDKELEDDIEMEQETNIETE